MKKLRLVFFVFLLLAAPAGATSIPACTAAPLSAYLSLPSTGCAIGNYIFSGFTALVNVDPNAVILRPTDPARPGFQVETTDSSRRDWIELLSFSFGASNPSPGATGGGVGGGRVSASDLTIQQVVDKANPQLFGGCCTGTHFFDFRYSQPVQMGTLELLFFPSSAAIATRQFTVTLHPVPEPSAIVLWATAWLAAVRAARGRRRSPAHNKGKSKK